MKGVCRGWREAMPHIEGAGTFVLGMNNDRADTGDVGGGKRPQHSVAQQSGSNPFALPVERDRQSRQHHHGDWITPKPFSQPVGRRLESNLSDNKRVVANDGFTGTRDIGLSRLGLLVRPCVVDQIAIERVLPAIECLDRMPPLQLFKDKITHRFSRPGEQIGAGQKLL